MRIHCERCCDRLWGRIACVWWSGGVARASLNHRLMAATPCGVEEDPGM
jgi:hypothetical protein